MAIRKRTLISIGLGLVIAAATAGRLLRRYEIVEASMQPAFEPGDWVVSRRRRGVPHRGEVVVFEHPGRQGMFLVKRAIGLPGERVEIADGHVTVDGRALGEPWSEGPTFPNGTWHISDDAVFLLGDRRALSAGDGRSTGPIPLTDVAWIVVARYWPLTRAGFV